MLSILRNITGSQKLLTSHLYDEKAFYRTFLQDLGNAKRNIVIESPYLTERRVNYFISLLGQLRKRKVKIRVNTRHPKLHSPLMQAQAEKALRILVGSQIKVYTYSDQRHWKLAAIDKTILWEGSLNILSHSKSREIMRRTNSPYLCRQMLRFIEAFR